MRSWLFAVILAGCAGRVAEPSWPKPFEAADAKDGGEAIAPHQAKQNIVAIERADDDAKPQVATAPTVAAVTPAIDVGTPAVAPASTTTEEVITSEEIIIEIDE